MITCPETLTHQLKRCWFDIVSVLHAIETCTRNWQFQAGQILMSVVVQINQLNLMMEVDTGLGVAHQRSHQRTTMAREPFQAERNESQAKNLFRRDAQSSGIYHSRCWLRSSESTNASACGRWHGPIWKNWLLKIRFNWTELLHKVENENCTLEDVLQKHPEVFKEGLRLVKNYSAQIHVDPKP